MKVGLQIYSFSWPGGPEAIGPTLARSVRTADEVGFDSEFAQREDAVLVAVGTGETDDGSFHFRI